jgi:hypothetical protein
MRARVTNGSHQDDSLIVPGQAIGRLRLGDTRENVLKLFPFKPNIDQESLTEGCGVEYLWVDLENAQRVNVFVRLQNTRVFQIESATTRYRTATGIKVYDSPIMVRSKYSDLRAYGLLHNSAEALGGGPLIFWVDWTKGLAFCFAATRRGKYERYLYSIIVFEPGGKFCPSGESNDSPDWRELAPYSLEVAGDRPLKN